MRKRLRSLDAGGAPYRLAKPTGCNWEAADKLRGHSDGTGATGATVCVYFLLYDKRHLTSAMKTYKILVLG